MSHQLRRTQHERERENGGKGVPPVRLEVATLVSVKERARLLLFKSKTAESARF